MSKLQLSRYFGSLYQLLLYSFTTQLQFLTTSKQRSLIKTLWEKEKMPAFLPFPMFSAFPKPNFQILSCTDFVLNKCFPFRPV